MTNDKIVKPSEIYGRVLTYEGVNYVPEAECAEHLRVRELNAGQIHDYVKRLEAAEQRAERYEKALREIARNWPDDAIAKRALAESEEE